MACNGGDGRWRLARRLATQIQAELGVLGLSCQQCVVDHLGIARSRLRSDFSPILSCFHEYPWRAKKQSVDHPHHVKSEIQIAAKETNKKNP